MRNTFSRTKLGAKGIERLRRGLSYQDTFLFFRKFRTQLCCVLNFRELGVSRRRRRRRRREEENTRGKLGEIIRATACQSRDSRLVRPKREKQRERESEVISPVRFLRPVKNVIPFTSIPREFTVPRSLRRPRRTEVDVDQSDSVLRDRSFLVTPSRAIERTNG